MSTRRVPTALHRELSEYASLLRALRTRDALDVTKHLTRSEISLSDDAQTGKPRDHWTRWPLMSNDVLEPEWTLEDEVAVIASHVLRTLPPRPASPTPSEEPEDDIVVLDMQPEDDDPDHAHYIPSLTCIISNYLSIILSQLASLTPPRPASMQNRVEPLNWRAVIDAVVSLRDPQISNPMVLRNVVRRLEGIYGPSLDYGVLTSHRAIDRAQRIVASMDRQRHQQDKLFATIFDQLSPTSTVHPVESRSTKRGQVLTEDKKEERAWRLRIAKGKRAEGEEQPDTDWRPRRSLRVKSTTRDTSSRSASPRSGRRERSHSD